MKKTTLSLGLSAVLAVLLLLGCGETLLKYKSVNYQDGWHVTWDDTVQNPPALTEGAVILHKNGIDGIGTIVIRDGLRCKDNGIGPKFVLLATIPATDLSVVSGLGYQVTVMDNGRGKGWTFDLSQTCGLGLQVTDAGIDVSHEPGYRPGLVGNP